MYNNGELKMKLISRTGFIVLSCLLTLLVALTVMAAISENLSSGGGLAFIQALVSCGVGTLAIAIAFVLLVLFNKTCKRYFVYIAIGVVAVTFLYFIFFFCAITAQNIAAISNRISGTATTPATNEDYFYLITHISFFAVFTVAAAMIIATFRTARIRDASYQGY